MDSEAVGVETEITNCRVQSAPVVQDVQEVQNDELPRSKLRVSELGDEICSKGIAPECFYRGSSHGSTLLTMTLSARRMGHRFVWILDRSIRE